MSASVWVLSVDRVEQMNVIGVFDDVAILKKAMTSAIEKRRSRDNKPFDAAKVTFEITKFFYTAHYNLVGSYCDDSIDATVYEMNQCESVC